MAEQKIFAGPRIRRVRHSLGLTQTAMAEALGISRQLLHGILREAKPVTPETALRLGKLFGNGPTLWLRMQQEFDLWHAARSLADDLKRIETHAV